MIVTGKNKSSRRPGTVPAWHATFLAMLPTIKTHAKIAFRHLDPEAREEAAARIDVGDWMGTVPCRHGSTSRQRRPVRRAALSLHSAGRAAAVLAFVLRIANPTSRVAANKASAWAFRLIVGGIVRPQIAAQRDGDLPLDSGHGFGT
ncbi:MAG: hypothetical protein ABIK89_04725 [Planctomycetota bacterium]